MPLQANQEVLSRVPESTDEEMESAVAAAKAAFPAWSNTSVSVRSRIMFKLQELIREHTDEMADVITVELGKVTADAKGDIFRGLEIVEQACAMGQTMLGDTLGNVSANMDTVMIRQPLGVCGGITPFNFPAMIPLWMFPGKSVAIERVSGLGRYQLDTCFCGLQLRPQLATHL